MLRWLNFLAATCRGKIKLGNEKSIYLYLEEQILRRCVLRRSI